MEKILDIISQAPLFNGLSQEQLNQIRQIAIDKFYDKGQTIFLESDDCNGFYIVVAGKVKIYKVSFEGKEHILHIYGPGNPFGEVPVFSGQKFPANAETLFKSRLLFIPRQAFVDLISEHPSLALNMLAILSMRLRQFTVQVENLSLKEVPARLASYLTYLADEQATGDYVSLTISKGQLASLLGTIPETLSRILAKMSKQDLIQVEGRNITLLNRNGLEELAQQGKLQ
ncbi:MAG: Crp/Fnr family transcriptional regulator [Deltaproteobacteria bacterium]|nr:Crp/Fnr family transcriptional regulator [Deltaproteobacteria bacterium]MBW2598258.1 Crp/Fnr family transcriptional regulator [Deltaproteobacteria bacterium]MBW2679798.1 Crp/Fnr family transcriptional regulator [Deltaproteobacteria bacterium]